VEVPDERREGVWRRRRARARAEPLRLSSNRDAWGGVNKEGAA